MWKFFLCHSVKLCGAQNDVVSSFNKYLAIFVGIDGLQYWGDAHVKLEINHSVTDWFGPEQTESIDYPVPKSEETVIVESVIDIMGR